MKSDLVSYTKNKELKQYTEYGEYNINYDYFTVCNWLFKHFGNVHEYAEYMLQLLLYKYTVFILKSCIITSVSIFKYEK